MLLVEILIDLGEDLLQIHVTLSGPASHQYHDLVIDLRVEHLEAELFQFGFDGVHAEPVRQRRIHVERFMRLLLRIGWLDVTPSTSVVHAVGKLDHQNTHVPAHGHHHLADGFGLCGIPVFHFGKLGHAINEARHGIAELGTALLKRVVGIFDRIVQQTRRHDNRSHAQIGKNLRDGQRVDDVRLAGLAPLRAMLLDGTLIGARQNTHILIGMVVFAHLQNRFKWIKRIRADLATQHVGRTNLVLIVAHLPPPLAMLPILPVPHGMTDASDRVLCGRMHAWRTASGGHAGRAEAAFGAIRTRQRRRRHESRLDIALDHQLRDAVPRLECHGVFRIEVDQRNLDFTTVAGINRARGVEHGDAALDGEPRTGVHQGDVASR